MRALGTALVPLRNHKHDMPSWCVRDKVADSDVDTMPGVDLRIVYRFVSDHKVTVSFQQPGDGKVWKTTAVGTGEKTGP